MSDLAARDFHRILFIKPSSPGDIIHALPVLHGLRRRYPKAHLAWLVSSSFADLIEADPAINEVIRFDRRRFARLGRSLQVTREFIAFVRQLRSRRFDLVIDLQGLFRSGFLAYASGAGVRIGFAASREMAWLFYTDKIRPDARAAHAADKNYAIAGLLGFEDQPMDFDVRLAVADRARAAELLKTAGFLPGERYAVLAPGTRWETKCWPSERFGRLAAVIKQRHYLDSVLVGGAADAALAEAAVAVSGGAAKNLCGKTNLRQLAAIVEKAAVVVTADSMPMHVAAAMRRPLVALFGPTDPLRTGPYGCQQDVLRFDLPCSPCYLRRRRDCRHGHACMQQLEVEIVAEAGGAHLVSSTWGGTNVEAGGGSPEEMAHRVHDVIDMTTDHPHRQAHQGQTQQDEPRPRR